MVVGKDKHPEGALTQELEPIEAKTLVSKHTCRGMAGDRQVTLVVPRGWQVRSGRTALCEGIAFCPWCGLELGSLNR